MLVLVSFVLVLAAAVTLVVGLLQSGLTLIYLSIACSVLAGIVLAVAVLRGRPEPKPAAAGRSFTPPARPTQVPASVGAPTSGAESTTSWSAPTSTSPPPAPPPPRAPSPAPAAGPDEATKAAGTALLGRLRGKRAQADGGAAAAPVPEPVPVPAPAAADTGPASADETMEVPVLRGGDEADDGFPIADYDRLRATELLSRLPALDRNQLEAVRQREASGKNRFTVMSRIDSLLAAQQDPAWQVEGDEWESGAGVDAESEAVLIEAEAIQEEEEFATALDTEEEFAAAGEVEDDEVDQMAAPAGDFPIAGYESLTVGQILPRLSELDADQLAQVRAREQEGRARGTILDRIDRLAAKSGAGAMAMPPAAGARKAPARKTPARKAPAARRTAAVEAPPAATPAPAPAAKKTRARKAAVAAPPVETPVKKARGRKAAPDAAAIPLPAPEPTPPPRKAPGRARKAEAAPTPAPPVEAPVKKARAKKAAAPAKKTTKKRP